MNLSDRQRLTESAVISTVGVIFAISSLYIPVLNLLFIFAGVPYVIITARNGVKYGVLSIFVSFFILMSTGVLNALYLFFLLFIPSVFIGHQIDKSDNPFDSISWGVISSIITIMIGIKLTDVIIGSDIINQIEKLIKEIVTMQYNLIDKVNMSDYYMDKKTALKIMYSVVPSIFMCSSIMISFANYYMAVYILRRIKGYTKQLPRFIEFTLPGNITMGILIICLLTSISKNIPGIHYEALVTNIVLIFSVIFFWQGISVYVYFLEKLNIGSGLKALFVIVTILMGPMFMIISCMGLLDATIDFRKIRRY